MLENLLPIRSSAHRSFGPSYYGQVTKRDYLEIEPNVIYIPYSGNDLNTPVSPIGADKVLPEISFTCSGNGV